MTTDAFLNILLTVLLPGLMALFGGILAARSLPSEPGKRNPEKWGWIAIFMFLFLVSVVLAFVQQVRATHAQQVSDDKAHQLEVKNTGDVKYMQGQLDSINKVLGTLSANSDPKQTASILRGLMPIMASGKSALEKISDKQLQIKVLEFVRQMREFGNKFNQQEAQQTQQQMAAMMAIPSSDATRKSDEWTKQNQITSRMYDQFQFDFKDQFLGVALSYRDELLRRLGPQPPETGIDRPMALEGWIAPLSVDATATYLEKLARKLP
jgi:hypothetical protein